MTRNVRCDALGRRTRGLGGARDVLEIQGAVDRRDRWSRLSASINVHRFTGHELFPETKCARCGVDYANKSTLSSMPESATDFFVACKAEIYLRIK